MPGMPAPAREGETHFAVTIVSAAFAGLSRVARQRLVYEALAEELATRVHALSLTTLIPGGRSILNPSILPYAGIEPTYETRRGCNILSGR